MYRGNTKDHKDYSRYSCETQLNLIRQLINKEDQAIKYYNNWINQLKENEIIESRHTYEISKLKEQIGLYKYEINEYIKIIEPTLTKKTNIKYKTYLMKDNHTGLYKIGKSSNPKNRERTLQGEKSSIKMVKVWNCDIEKKLHVLYSEFRIRGEWFKLTRIQVKYICTHYGDSATIISAGFLQ